MITLLSVSGFFPWKVKSLGYERTDMNCTDNDHLIAKVSPLHKASEMIILTSGFKNNQRSGVHALFVSNAVR